MIETSGLINVYSEMNPWIDYVVSVDKDFDKAKKIISQAFDSWFDDKDAEFISMTEWIKDKLNAAGIQCEFYYKEESEEDGNV